MKASSAIVVILIFTLSVVAAAVRFNVYLKEARVTQEEQVEEAPVVEEEPKVELGFDSISMKPGHPRVKKDEDHYAYNDTWYSVRPGRAKTAKDCWEHAKRNDIPSWGFRKHDKSCWHYQDSVLLSEPAKPGSEANHTVGCTEHGVDVDDGCIDFKTGHTVWGHRKKALQAPGVVHQWHDLGTGGTRMTHEQCRKKGKKAGIKVVGYRTSLHPTNEWKATCWGYHDDNTTKGWAGNASDYSHITMCTEKTKKVREGC